MIMAAGIGSRLEPLTLCKPKPMVPIANIPVIEHILRLLYKHNIKKVIANTHYLPNQITSHFSNIDIDIEFIHEDSLSGTAGGVKKCEWFFEETNTFVVMSGDSLTNIDLTALIKKHKEAKALATMGLKSVQKEEVVNLGVVVTNEAGKVLEFQEKPPVEEAKSTLVNTGIYVFESELFDYIPADTFYDFAKQVFPAIMADNKAIYGFDVDEYWNDIGTLNQYLLSSYDIIDKKVGIDINLQEFEHGWKGGNINFSDNVQFKGKVILGNNVQIKDNVLFKEHVTTGNNCFIDEGSTLEGCLLWDNVRIGKNVTLKNCILGNNVNISDNAVIKEGAILADNCSVSEGQVIPENTKLKPNQILV